MTYKLTHARHDPAHCLCPGLFRSFKKGDRKKTPLNCVYDYGNERIEIAGPELLGAQDLRILQGLIAMSGPKGVVLHMDQPKSVAGEQLTLRLDPKWNAIADDALVIKGSFYELAKEIGMANPSGGSEARLIRESIERLWKVSMIVVRGKERRGYHILGDYCSNESSGKLFVALNPRIAAAVMGTSRFTNIDMNEVRCMNIDATRLIHQRLCGFINPGKAHPTPIGVEALAGYVWHDSEVVAGGSAERTRRQVIKAALAELVALGWCVTESTKNKFMIGRPAATVGVIPVLVTVP